MKAGELFMIGLAGVVLGITVIFFGSLYVTQDFVENFQMGMYVVWAGIGVVVLGLGLILYTLFKRKKKS